MLASSFWHSFSVIFSRYKSSPGYLYGHGSGENVGGGRSATARWTDTRSRVLSNLICENLLLYYFDRRFMILTPRWPINFFWFKTNIKKDFFFNVTHYVSLWSNSAVFRFQFLLFIPNYKVLCLRIFSVSVHILYYFDRSFMVCYTLPNLFTGHIVHGQLLPVAGGNFVRSYQILVRNFSCIRFSALYLRPPLWPQLRNSITT